jgi:CDP-diacylglycerol--glycerol-3-phosphate 3-phosphatidyltransferase
MSTNKKYPGFRFSIWAHSWGDPILHKISKGIVKLGVTPNNLTVLGFGLSCLTAYLLTRGKVTLSGWILLLAGLCDVLDGPLAKVSNTRTNLGAFLDSVVDQFSDVVIFVSIVWFYIQASAPNEVLLASIVLGNLLVISYIRAKAALLQVDCSIGPVGRFERTLLTIIGLILNHLSILLWILAILTSYTAIKRLWFTLRCLSSEKTG